MTYSSRVDTGIGALLFTLGLVSLGCVIFGIVACFTIVGLPIGVTFIVSGVVIGALLGIVVWPVSYTLSEDALLVRFGVMCLRVPYGDIQLVRSTKSLLSAPALSLRRLEIVTKTGRVVISPRASDAFLRDLALRTPHL